MMDFCKVSTVRSYVRTFVFRSPHDDRVAGWKTSREVHDPDERIVISGDYRRVLFPLASFSYYFRTNDL